MFVENKNIICLLCLYVGLAVLYVARELASPLEKVGDSILLFGLDGESFVDG